MVRCSNASPGTCCTEDRTGHPAWKYSKTNIFIGTSCAEARMAFCKDRGTYGTKYCPGPSTRPVANQHLRTAGAPLTTSQTDPYGKAPAPKGALRSRFNDNYLNDRLTQVHTFGNTPAGQIKGSLKSRFPNGVPNLTPSFSQGSGVDSGAPAAKKGDITSQLCPYFKWMPISDDCKIQVLAGAAVVVLGGAFLLRMLH